MTSQPGRDGNPLLIERVATDLDNEKHEVERNLRESPLDMLKARERIDKIQYDAGDMFRKDWEIASIGSDRASDLERLPSGVWADMSYRQAEAMARINAALQQQNRRGRRLIIGVCAERKWFQDLARELNASERYIAERFKEAVEDLAEHYGLVKRGKFKT